MNLASYIEAQRNWSSTTFGPGKRTVGICEHIRKELAEIEAAPDDVEEFCDVVILALDGAWRAGHSPEEICAALERKQAKNLARKWPPPGPQDQPTEHVREVTFFVCGDCDPCLSGQPEQCVNRCPLDSDPTPYCAVCRAHTSADCHCPPDADFVDAVERLKEESKS